MDMVCEKENHVEIDFETDGLKLLVDGDFLKAEGTTLGGDDGIAVAYALAILEDDTLPHPPLEVVITVDEEVGLLGAESIDLSMLKGKKLLNIDSDEEGIFLTSCAGGLRADCRMPVTRTEAEGIGYEIQVTGLKGHCQIHDARIQGRFHQSLYFCAHILHAPGHGAQHKQDSDKRSVRQDLRLFGIQLPAADRHSGV